MMRINNLLQNSANVQKCNVTVTLFCYTHFLPPRSHSAPTDEYLLISDSIDGSADPPVND